MSKSFSSFDYCKKPEGEDMQSKVRKSYDELKDLDKSALEERLIREVNRQKAENTFNFDLLSSSVESMRSFLSPQTYEDLKNLLERIK